MLKWLEGYYVGESVHDSDHIREKLDQGKLVPGIFLITFSHNPHNILEILPAAMLVQKSFFRICPEIIGMAKGKYEALELVRSIVEAVYQDTGDVLVEEYLKNR